MREMIKKRSLEILILELRYTVIRILTVYMKWEEMQAGLEASAESHKKICKMAD